jgi:hypothetical protein
MFFVYIFNMAKTKPTKKSDSKSTTKQTPSKGIKKSMVGKGKVTTYTPISHHIYHDGYSYRVRVSINGTKHSQSFSSKRKAFAFRRSILSGNL